MAVLTDGAGYKYIGKPTKQAGNSFWVSDAQILSYTTDLVSLTAGFPNVVASAVPTSGYNSNAYIHWRQFGSRYTDWVFMVTPARGNNVQQSRFRLGGVDTTHLGNMTITHEITYFTAFACFNPTGSSYAQYRVAEPTPGNYTSCLTYQGKLVSINPHSYYQTYFDDTCISLVLTDYTWSSTSWNTTSSGYLYHNHSDTVEGKLKSLLTTGDALYSPTCFYGETPGSMQVTDWIVFHSHSLYNNPYIGRVENLLLGHGTGWQRGQIYKIAASSVGYAADGGSPYYIATGRFMGTNGPVVLMRIGDFS